MIKAIAFDVDNTLLDFDTFKKETAKAAARALVKAGLKDKPSRVAKKIFEIYDEYGIEYQKTFSSLLWHKYKIRDFNEFERLQHTAILAYQKKKFQVLKPYPKVKSTLKRLKNAGVRLCVVSDAPRNKAWQRLVLTGLAGFFELVVSFDDTKQAKPHSMPFEKLLNELKLPACDVLMVGDNPERDVKGAKALGMKTALAGYGWVLHKNSKVKPDFVLKSFGELPALVRALEH
ncbi:MAG: HAD-IA family hydrolase [Candidatus Micrarchaeota archaeon]